ncbi:MAG: DUF4012 domain-containing protein [Candidatus Moranbacteria bacterium]|nr:DUF4012 domain-containing protein [Candidatus Moranbacteria bacterium]
MENKNKVCSWTDRNKINLRMSDIRPANQGGGSQMGRIGQAAGRPVGSARRAILGDIRRPDRAIPQPVPAKRSPINRSGLSYPAIPNGAVRVKIESNIRPTRLADKPAEAEDMTARWARFSGADGPDNNIPDEIVFGDPDGSHRNGRLAGAGSDGSVSFARPFPARQYNKRILFSFAGVAAAIFLVIAGTGLFNKGMGIKDAVLGIGQGAYIDLAMAKDGMAGRDFQKSAFEFGEAYDKFGRISQDINSLGGIMVETSRFIPFFSKISSGDHIAQAGKDVSRIGILASEIMQSLEAVKNPLKNDAGPTVSFLQIFQNTDRNLKEIAILMQDVQDNLDKVNLDDIPADKRAQFAGLKNQLPETNRFLAEFIGNSQIFTDVLGGNGPRKYLFLFQNNQEMRATGGFIGTYGVLDIFNGNVRRFFIDGIYNPDGQLREKVVPPVPIQKISAAWSLHDSNWFPDFPKSAEKAAWFYEKTGGPTVDGVITMTPTVMQKMLEITGPIELPEYGVTVDKDNFIEKIQYEVEVDYDKELNKPKQILADLAPKILDRLFNVRNFSDIARTADVLSESLNEKQILIYSKNYEIESVLSKQGWSGEILDTQKDYLSVINTNINGYKTDGVVDEKIEHQAEIQPDGSVVDTLTVTRHHNGGSLAHEWWNKVNADYMRVYVPKGSILLSAEGQTREYNTPPLDYRALAFKQDAQVRMEEDSLKIDEESGTKIYEDSDKTVFANWAYVSPQETVTIRYKYLLPFKLAMDSKNKPVDTYSLLAQKQAGSLGSGFISRITYPDKYKMVWNYPEQVTRGNNNIRIESDLKTDKFVGAAFTQR